MKRNKLLSVLLIVLLCMILAACGREEALALLEKAGGRVREAIQGR